MRPPKLRLIALLALFSVAAGPAFAIPGSTPTGADGSSAPEAGQPNKTTSELLYDLGAAKAPDRLYAARALKAQLTRSLRVVAHARAGSLAGDEALSNLDELEVRLPEQCRAALQYPNVVAPAAEMLALLKVTDATGAVRAAATAETRKGPKRRLEAAAATLEALGSAPPADAPAPTPAVDAPTPTPPVTAPPTPAP